MIGEYQFEALHYGSWKLKADSIEFNYDFDHLYVGQSFEEKVDTTYTEHRKITKNCNGEIEKVSFWDRQLENTFINPLGWTNVDFNKLKRTQTNSD